MALDVRFAGFLQVEEFLARAGKSLETFRYFKTRNVGKALEQHHCTLLGFDIFPATAVSKSEIPVVYGHLDKEKDTTWLGLCVAEGFANQGYGKAMLRELLRRADEYAMEVRLTVDDTNEVARKLYEKFGFYSQRNIQSKLYMKRNADQMADTLGSLVDKLATVNQKMFVNQELLYEIRRMNFDEFKGKYFSDEKGAEKLWETLKKACDLNVQRAELVKEVDEKVLQIAQAAASGKELDNGSFVQRPHKTY